MSGTTCAGRIHEAAREATLRHTPPAGPPPPRSSACVGPRAAPRQINWTALHHAAAFGRADCVESLLKAGADASLKDDGADNVSDGAEGRGGRHCGVGARAWGGGGGRGPEQAPRRLSAPPSPRPLLPGRPPLPPPSPHPAAVWQDGVGPRQAGCTHGGHYAPGVNARFIAAQVSAAPPHPLCTHPLRLSMVPCDRYL